MASCLRAPTTSRSVNSSCRALVSRRGSRRCTRYGPPPFAASSAEGWRLGVEGNNTGKVGGGEAWRAATVKVYGSTYVLPKCSDKAVASDGEIASLLAGVVTTASIARSNRATQRWLSNREV